MIKEYYEETTQQNFADMLDYAVNDCGYTLDQFQDIFIKSKVAKKLDENDVLLLVGHSGIEWVDMIIPKNRQSEISFNPYSRSIEYWTGWAFGYFWLYSYYTIEEILKEVSFLDISKMYHPYHEMDITKFYDEMLFLCNGNKLKKYRNMAKLSQRDLAILSDVPIKTIQKYESNERSISKAQVDIIIRLARALNCTVEDLVI